jgi:hypothetical protein
MITEQLDNLIATSYAIVLYFSEKSDYLVKNHRIILINFWIIHIWWYFAYHILYHIRVSSSESDILIHRIPIYRIWILKYEFVDGFGTEIILSVYIPIYTVPSDIHPYVDLLISFERFKSRINYTQRKCFYVLGHLYFGYQLLSHTDNLMSRKQ